MGAWGMMEHPHIICKQNLILQTFFFLLKRLNLTFVFWGFFLFICLFVFLVWFFPQCRNSLTFRRLNYNKTNADKTSQHSSLKQMLKHPITPAPVRCIPVEHQMMKFLITQITSPQCTASKTIYLHPNWGFILIISVLWWIERNSAEKCCKEKQQEPG